MTRRRGRRPETMAQDARVLEMYRAGATTRQISYTMKISEGTVRAGIKRACQDYFRLEAEDRRIVEEDRLKFVIRQLSVLLNEPSYVVAPNGKVAVNPLTGEPLVDNGEKRQTLMALTKVSESLRKLMGTDEPARHRVETVDHVDAQIEDLVRQLENNNGAAAGRLAGLEPGSEASGTSEAPRRVDSSGTRGTTRMAIEGSSEAAPS